jgi:pilus assembly protein CpaE
MYPLNAVLIGIQDPLLFQVRRELNNYSVNVECECSSVVRAVERLRSGGTEKRLLVFQIRSADAVEELKRLSGIFTSWPILALIGPDKEENTFARANRAGATQVVSLPLQVEDFQEALSFIGVRFGNNRESGKVMAVFSVTGGGGGTTLAINLAHEMATKHGRHSILAELSMQMGVLGTYLDVDPPNTIHDLLRHSERIDAYMVQQSLIRIADNFDILAGPQRVIEPLSVTGREILQLVELAKGQADVLVLDMPCTYDAVYLDVLGRADEVVLVAEQKVPSIRALKMLRDNLARAGSTSTQTIVLNRYDLERQGFTVRDMSSLLEVSRILTVANDWPGVQAAVNQGRPLRLVAPRSPILADIEALTCCLLGVADQPQREVRGAGVLNRLARAFGIF